MKKIRPFLALLLACWLLMLPALADGEAGGDSGESPPASDGAEDSAPSFQEEAPDPPASESAPPEREEPPDASGDIPSVPGDTPSAPESPPPDADPVPVEPEPPETPIEPVISEAPVDPVSPEAPVVTPDIPATAPETPPPPVYAVPGTPLVPDTLDIPADAAPTAESHEVFTVTTIPEFARAALEPDSENTLAQAVRDLFGTYTPKVQVVNTYVDGELISAEEQYVPGVAGMDWEWLAGFSVFLLMLYCLFRLLGGSVKYG